MTIDPTNQWPYNSLAIMRHEEKKMPGPDCRAVLLMADVLHLAMYGDGWPYVVPVNFALVDDIIYIHSGRTGRKLELLAQHARVCFQAECDVALSEPSDPDRACQYGMRFRSVVGFGTAAIHTDLPTLQLGLDALMARYSSREFTYPETILEKTAIIAVTIEILTGKQRGWEE